MFLVGSSIYGGFLSFGGEGSLRTTGKESTTRLGTCGRTPCHYCGFIWCWWRDCCFIMEEWAYLSHHLLLGSESGDTRPEWPSVGWLVGRHPTAMLVIHSWVPKKLSFLFLPSRPLLWLHLALSPGFIVVLRLGSKERWVYGILSKLEDSVLT